MKKIILIIICVILLFGLTIITSKTKPSINEPIVTPTESQTLTYTGTDIGLKFKYTNEYIVDERMPVDLGEVMIKTIILPRVEDVNNPPPEGGEGAPVITISVFTNEDNQSADVWALENEQYSLFNLKLGDESEAVVGGANAVRYMADGLYASENYVVAHGGLIYVITGQFMDENSDIRNDFVNLVESIEFIPVEGIEE